MLSNVWTLAALSIGWYAPPTLTTSGSGDMAIPSGLDHPQVNPHPTPNPPDVTSVRVRRAVPSAARTPPAVSPDGWFPSGSAAPASCPPAHPHGTARGGG